MPRRLRVAGSGTRPDADDLLVASACRIADAVGRTFGPDCEVAVHDLRRPTRSLVHLVNGEVTGRQLGSPIRDLIYRVLPDMDIEQGGLFNYSTVLEDGRRLKSSTCLIRNEGGDPLVAFCINLDVTRLESALAGLTALTHLDDASPMPGSGGADTEPQQIEIGDILRHLVINIARPAGRDPAGLSKNEKLAVVDFLDKKGAFRIRGSVQMVAKELATSEPTIYRYIDEVRRAELPANRQG